MSSNSSFTILSFHSDLLRLIIDQIWDYKSFHTFVLVCGRFAQLGGDKQVQDQMKKRFRQYKTGSSDYGSYTYYTLPNEKWDGIYRGISENGRMMNVRTYANGRLHGYATQYPLDHDSDPVVTRMECQSHYNNGKLDGPCGLWYYNGAIKRRAYYKDGVRVSMTSYHITGKVATDAECIRLGI